MGILNVFSLNAIYFIKNHIFNQITMKCKNYLGNGQFNVSEHASIQVIQHNEKYLHANLMNLIDHVDIYRQSWCGILTHKQLKMHGRVLATFKKKIPSCLRVNVVVIILHHLWVLHIYGTLIKLNKFTDNRHAFFSWLFSDGLTLFSETFSILLDAEILSSLMMLRDNCVIRSAG